MKNDRGMKKFAPFKSLKGQDTVLEEMMREKNKIAKPELDENQIEKISETLSYLNIEDSPIVEISYFKCGYIYSKKGEVIKITNDSIKIAGYDCWIKFIDILDIEIIS